MSILDIVQKSSKVITETQGQLKEVHSGLKTVDIKVGTLEKKLTNRVDHVEQTINNRVETLAINRYTIDKAKNERLLVLLDLRRRTII
jgi:hypothetical protein